MSEALFSPGGAKPRIETVRSEAEGTEFTKNLLYKECNPDTILFLSGGRTPRALYEALAKEKKLKVGAVAMIDDRYGPPMHPISNELVVAKTGFFDFLETEGIPYFVILEAGLTRGQVAAKYNETVRDFINKYEKRIAILGLGVDGHTAGIAPNRPDFVNPLFGPDQQRLFVSDFADPKPMSPEGSPTPPYGFGERITLTPHALSKMDQVLLMVFGRDKKPGLDLIFQEGTVEDAPARFLMTEEMAKKTILITDQKV